MSIATSGSWRETIDLRFVCDAPVDTSILGGDPAVVLQCRRRIGGWPQVAMVAAVSRRIYQADGIQPTLAVMERSIGVLSGRISATTVALPPSAPTRCSPRSSQRTHSAPATSENTSD